MFLCFLSMCFLSTAAFANGLKMGVAPQQKASVLSKAWKPYLEKISEIYGEKIEFATAKSIPGFEKKPKNGEYVI